MYRPRSTIGKKIHQKAHATWQQLGEKDALVYKSPVSYYVHLKTGLGLTTEAATVTACAAEVNPMLVIMTCTVHGDM